jgi:hypothetical protein
MMVRLLERVEELIGQFLTKEGDVRLSRLVDYTKPLQE